MNYILFDDAHRDALLPLTFVRPVADIRLGILTIREKWEHYLKSSTSSLTEPYLGRKFPIHTEEHNVLINGSILPDRQLADLILSMQPGQVINCGETLVAYHITADELDRNIKSGEAAEFNIDMPLMKLRNCWDVFMMNDAALLHDYEVLTSGRRSQPLSETNRISGEGKIFLEEGAIVEHSVINATAGPVYIGKNAQVMEGCLIRGPVALLDHSVLKMGARIYGATTIGPWCKVGGEVNNSVFFGYSNKAHDGFLGNSVIGEWCNLGAATNCSNLKNTYDTIRIWCYSDQSFINTGLQFCGLIMGDHSKSGINTMFNTGTVVGVSSNVFGAGFPRNFIPSFAWGGTAGFQTYNFRKALQVARTVMNRRGMELTHDDELILEEVFSRTYSFRRDQ